MSILRLSFLLFCLLFLCNCGPVYSVRKSEILQSSKEEDWGKAPPDNYKDIEKELILSMLKDPDSAKFSSWGFPKKNVIPDGYLSTKPKLIWSTNVQVNAKNSYGGYTGSKYYYFAWSNGELFAFSTPSNNSDAIFWKYIGKAR